MMVLELDCKITSPALSFFPLTFNNHFSDYKSCYYSNLKMSFQFVQTKGNMLNNATCFNAKSFIKV